MNLQSSFSSFHQLTRDFFLSRTTCEAPMLANKIQPLGFITGLPFSYIIPDQTFNDKEDGGTRSLSLTMQPNSGNFPLTCWYIFNQTSQKVHGLPYNDFLSGASSLTLTFKLTATDSCLLSAMDNVSIDFQRPSKHCFEMMFTFKTAKTYSCEWIPVKMFVDKVASFYGLSNLSDIGVVSYSKADNNNDMFHVKMSLSQRKVRCEPCDFIKISDMTGRVLRTSDNTIRSEFNNFIFPMFTATNITAAGIDSCSPAFMTTAPPVITRTLKPTTPDTG